MDKDLVAASFIFFVGFCINMAAAYYLAMFSSSNEIELTNRMINFILSSYMAVSLEQIRRKL